MSGTHSVVVREVVKSYGAHRVLDGVNLEVAANSVACILGPSGSGKSTLLRAINRLIPVDSGTIRVADQVIGYEERDGRLHELPDRAVCRQRRRIGMVFQDFNLFPHMSALDNVARGPISVNHTPKAQARARAAELLARVGLADKVGSYPSQLSGGQQQRVAIARALAMEPLLLLFDEPTSALDPELVGEVLAVIRDLAEAGETTMMVVTHEIGFAHEVADQVVFMENGSILLDGPTDEAFADAQPERVRSFLSGRLK